MHFPLSEANDQTKSLELFSKKRSGERHNRPRRANLAAVLNHAIDAGILHDNPAGKMAKFFKEARRAHEVIGPLSINPNIPDICCRNLS